MGSEQRVPRCAGGVRTPALGRVAGRRAGRGDRATGASLVPRLPVSPRAQITAYPPAPAVRGVHRRGAGAAAPHGRPGHGRGDGRGLTLMAGPGRAAAWIVGVVLGACERGGVQPSATTQVADSADQVLEGFAHYVTADGVRKSRIEADSAWFYEATQSATLHNVRITFFDAKGAERSKLTARRALYRWQDGSLDA